MERYSLPRWLRSLFQRRTKTHRRLSRPLLLEHLETRLAPATYTWNGAAGTPNWSAGLNWVGGIAPSGSPVTLDSLVFPAGSPQLSTIEDLPGVGGQPPTFNSITLAGSGYTIAALTPTSSPIVLGSASVAGSGNFNVSAGAVGNTVSANIQLASTGGNHVFTIGTTGNLTVTGQITGSGSNITKEGTGTLFLQGDDSGFLGPITIAVGVVQISDATALGSGTGVTTVLTNAQLQVSSLNLPIQEPLILNGPGINNGGALDNVAGDNTWAGSIVMDSNSTFGAAPDTELTINGQISDTGSGHSLTKEGLGEIFLEPFNVLAGNTYRGQTIINGGILSIGHPFALGPGGTTANEAIVNSDPTESGTLAIDFTGNPAVMIAPQYLYYDANGNPDGFMVPMELLVLNGPGAAGDDVSPRDLTTRTVPTDPIVTTSGTLTNFEGGTLDNLAGNNSWGQNPTGAAFEPTINLWTSPSTVFPDVAYYEPVITLDAAAGTTFTIYSVIQDPTYNPPGNPSAFGYSLSTMGPGNIVLTADNTFTAQVDVLQGILTICDSHALGDGYLAADPLGEEVWWGATLQLEADGIPDSVTSIKNSSGAILVPEYNLNLLSAYYIGLNGPGATNAAGTEYEGALDNLSGQNVINGNISLMSDAAIGVDPDPDPGPPGPPFANNDTWNYLSQLTINGVIDSVNSTTVEAFGSLLPNGTTPNGTVFKPPLVASGVTGATLSTGSTLTKVGGGELVLTAANTYVTPTAGSDQTFIEDGWITMENDQALGQIQIVQSLTGDPVTVGNPTVGDIPTLVGDTMRQQVVVASGAALVLKQDLNGNSLNVQYRIELDAIPLAINGPDGPLTEPAGNGLGLDGSAPSVPVSTYVSWLDQKGALENLGGLNTITGDITLDGVAGIGVELDGSLDPTPPFSELTILSSISESTAVNGGITKLGSQRLIIQGNGNYTGPVVVAEGVLRVQNNTALGLPIAAAIAGQNPTPDTTTVDSGAALELMQTNAQENGGVQTGLEIWNIQLILYGQGDPDFGDTPLTNLTGDNYWRGPVSLGTSVAFDVLPNTRLTINNSSPTTSPGVEEPTIDDLFNASADGSSLTKIDTGELDLDGIDSYRGNTYVQQGILTIGNSQALGAGASPGMQTVTINGNTGGTFTLTFNGQTTASLPGTATAQQVQTALNALSSVGGTGIVVTVSVLKNVYTVTFGGSADGFKVNQMTTAGAGGALPTVATISDGGGATYVFNGAQLQMAGNVTVANEPLVVQGTGSNLEPTEQTITLGGATTGNFSLTFNGKTTTASLAVGATAAQVAEAFNGVSAVQTVTVSGTAGTFTLGFGSQTTGSLAYNAAATDVATALNGLSNINGAVSVTETTTTITSSIGLTVPANVFTVTFGGSLADVAVATLTAAPSNGTAVAIATVLAGNPGLPSVVGAGIGGVVDVYSTDVAVYTLVFNGSFVGQAEAPVTFNYVPPSPLPTPAPAAVTAIVNTTITGGTPAAPPTGWNNDGPAPVADAQIEGFSGDAIASGRITGIATDPSDANVIYIATAGGGAWKTINSGTTWEPLFDGISAIQTVTVTGTTGTFTLTFEGQTTGSLAYNASAADVQAALNGLSAIAGSVTVTSAVSVTGSGATQSVYTITFSGGSLFEVNVPQTTVAGSKGLTVGAATLTYGTGPDAAEFCGAIAVAPNDPDIIYLGTGEVDDSGDAYYGTGVYESTNAGATWTQLVDSTGTIVNPLYGQGITSMVVGPQNPTLAYNSETNPDTLFVASSDLVVNAPAFLLTASGAVSTQAPVPGVWRFTSIFNTKTNAYVNTWFDMTSLASQYRSSAAEQPGNPAATNVASNFTTPPGTPGPDDDFRIAFPQTQTTWSSLALVYVNTWLYPVVPTQTPAVAQPEQPLRTYSLRRIG